MTTHPMVRFLREAVMLPFMLLPWIGMALGFMALVRFVSRLF